MVFSEHTALRRLGQVLSRAVLVTLFVLFAWANFSHWRSTGRPSGLGTTALEGWAAILFLVRRSPERLSVRPLAWVAAPVGSFAMLLARPHGGGLAQLPCELVQLGGVLLALASLATLGRSFGLVAADRGLKTSGPYRLVRLLLLSTVFQLVRIREEEAVLDGDAAYSGYRRSVPYRLVPRLY
jgi:protein-S-isoprenylcysteine O-methyltransferase Ste14